MRASTLVRAAALSLVASRLLRGVGARPPLARPPERPVPGAGTAAPTTVPITVVIAARDEAERIGPLLAALRSAPDVESVIVVDDRSSDRTAAVAGAAGASVIRGTDPPIGWAGKTWALAEGAEAAETDWIVTLDADVVPDPDLPRAAVARAIGDRLDLLTLAARSELDGGRWLHAAMLTQLVYRFGLPGTTRRVANGQCMVARRLVLLAGLRAVSASTVEDVALARRLAGAGRRVDFLDATELLVVRPYGSTAEVFTGWGRSIGLRDVEPWWRHVVEGVALAATLLAPPVRVVGRRCDVLDLATLAMRIGTLIGMRRAYERRGLQYWLSPIADPVGLAATATGLVRRSPTWRGRPAPRRVKRAARRWRSAGPRTSSAHR